MTSILNNSRDVNPSQKKVVEFRKGHLLVVAGPGTGKTHTLTLRICQLTCALKPTEKILAITFTNKAAGEMQQRLRSLLGRGAEQLTVGTFHGFCLSLIQKYSVEMGLSQNFRVASPDEIDSWAREIWPEKSAAQRRKAIEGISRLKSSGPDSAGEFKNDLAIYNDFLRREGCLDFDDILCGAVSLLKNHPQALAEIHAVYRFICVDEYQDINTVQHEFLKMIVGPESLMTAIGDPNQAIYGFRGSEVGFFESFTGDFHGAEVMTLNESYRSTANLLKASGQVIEKCPSALVPTLTAQIYDNGRLVVYEAPTEKAEAEYVVHQIEQLVGGTSLFSMDSGRVPATREGTCGFSDIAVLYRLNAQRRPLEEALTRSGIPFRVSGKRSFVDEELAPYQDFEENDLQKVNLMTLHAAKGLEFPAVFIIGCEQGLIPLNMEKMVSDIDEERRLFYVGMTRAKEALYLVRSARRSLYGKTLENGPSPFLEDIEESLKAYEAIKRKSAPKRSAEKQMDLFQ